MTQRTKSGVGTQVTTLLADNTSGDISASDLRSVFTDTVDSLVGGPASATDNALVRFDATTGQLVQNSAVIIDDSNNVSGVGTLACGATTITGTLAVSSTTTHSDDVTIATDKAIKTDTTTAHTAKLQAYDVDGTAYKTFITLTNANTPTIDISAPSGASGTIDNIAIGSVTPLTGAFTTASTTGLATLASAAVTGNLTMTGYILRSVGNALTATGTTRADALQLAKEVNNVTTAAASTGVILPTGVVGMRIDLFNAGANTIKVYANGSETIDGTSGSTGVSLTNAKRCSYWFTAANTWISAQLGVVSA